MKILYYDCFAGISGDMNLGALIDLGVPATYLDEELSKLNVFGYKLEWGPSVKMGISGTRANVILEHKHTHQEEHHHHGAHSHNHHRNLKDIKEIILSSPLSDFVKTKSMEMFQYIAEAEAKIHSKPVDEIHFHEVGAIDSIVDIVGAAICIEYLKPDKIIGSTVEVGGGFINIAHGTYPVPAPATAEILKGIPVHKGRVDKEATTPTGAAIVKVFVDEFSDDTDFKIDKVAYGIGYHDFSIPNILRVYIGESQGKSNIPGFETSSAILIECNIDDMNPEQYEYIMEKLFDAGAQDVYMTPIIMKKSRPAIQLSVLCGKQEQNKIKEILLLETTSLGLRYTTVTKSMLPRNIRTVETKYGPVRIKEALLNGKAIKYKAEYDDCAQAAKASGVSLHEIYEEIDWCLKREK